MLAAQLLKGIGLPQEHTWNYHVNQALSEEIGDEVKMFNVGKAGTGVDVGTRFTYVLIEHMKFKPDLVFFLIPPINRNEMVYAQKREIEWFDFAPSRVNMKNLTEKSLAHQYLSYITPLQRFHESIRTLLFFKSFLDSKGIPFILSTWCSARVHEIIPGVSIPHHILYKNYFPEELSRHFITAPFIQDEDKPIVRDKLTPDICFPPDYSDFEYKYPYNISRDGIHLGPNSNWHFAKKIFVEMKKLPIVTELLNEKSRIHRI